MHVRRDEKLVKVFVGESELEGALGAPGRRWNDTCYLKLSVRMWTGFI
jgi:hypothetical protein